MEEKKAGEYERRSTLKRLRETAMANKANRIKPRYELSLEQKKDLKAAFDIFDVNSSGFITVDDLRVAIRALGYNPTLSEIEDVVNTAITDGSGRIAFSDFVYLMNLRMAAKDSDADMLKALYLMCEENTNAAIDFEKLKAVAIELGEPLNDEELKELISVADLNHDGVVNADEYLAITRKAVERII